MTYPVAIPAIGSPAELGLRGARRRPAWLLAENVPALRTRGYDRVCDELVGLGYAVAPVVVGAWAVGAPHKRDRVWIVGRLADTRGTGTGRECGQVYVGTILKYPLTRMQAAITHERLRQQEGRDVMAEKASTRVPEQLST